ncbi:CHAT domain-containing protein [Kordia zhangzhouensis]|uniref:CHAT domain-containing protein n=1 Tax=Kordia zhangzhouensis TaxID=1620405 RepID=UPI0006297EF8|nr:CHAT domain-containing protein [Kordia zhangzhouensis]
MNSIHLKHFATIVIIGWLLLSCENTSKETKTKQTVVASEMDKKIADSLFEAGRQLYYKREFKKSATTFLKADSLYELQPNYEKQLKCYINTSVALQALYVDNDSILPILHKYIPVLDTLPNDMIEVCDYYNTLHLIHFNSGNYLDAKFYSEKSLARLEKMSDKSKQTEAFHSAYFSALRSVILNEQELYNYDKATEENKKLIAYSRANNYNIFSAEMELLTTYVYANELEKAETVLKHIEEETLVDEKNIFDAFDFYRAKIMLFMNKEQFEKALISIEELQRIIDDSGYTQHFSQWFLTQLKGDVFQAQKNHDKVISYIENLQIDANYEKASIGYRSADYQKLAKAYFGLKNYQKWQENIQKAINLHLPESQQTTDFFKKISLENARFKDFLITRVFFKAKSCFEMYKGTQNELYLEVALHIFKEAHQLMKSLGARSDEDAFITAEQFDQFYNDLFLLYHEKWLHGNEKNTFFEALSIGDESKNVLVLNELKKSSTKKIFTNIPQEIRDKEAYLQQTLDSFAYQNTISTTRKKQIEQEFKTLKDKIRTEFPNYFALKYDKDSSLQKLISQEFSAYNILSFSVTNQHIFIFNQNHTTYKFDKIVFSETLQKQLQNFSAALQNFQDNTYKENARLIFEKLVEPYLDMEKPTVLILDDVLNAIPFDVFREFTTYSQPFIRLTSLRQAIDNPHTSKSRTTVYAPFTQKNSLHSLWLPNSLEEAGTIQQITDADIKTDIQAEKRVFVATAKDYDVIHLATHSVVNKNAPLESAIYFYANKDNSPSEYILKAKSLYNLNFPAELITLSSCESGSGTYISGKGVQSISNAFYYAGAKSTVMSLWKVPDKTTAQIMDLFYQNLKAGKNKAIALQLAKQQYIELTDDENFTHPYYWASFVIAGDISPLELPKATNTWLYYAIGLFFLIITLFFRYRKVRS